MKLCQTVKALCWHFRIHSVVLEMDPGLHQSTFLPPSYSHRPDDRAVSCASCSISSEQQLSADRCFLTADKQSGIAQGLPLGSSPQPRTPPEGPRGGRRHSQTADTEQGEVMQAACPSVAQDSLTSNSHAKWGVSVCCLKQCPLLLSMSLK